MHRVVNALVKLHGILSRHGIKYIVLGSLADYLLGASAIEPHDVDVLVRSRDVEKINMMITWPGQGDALVKPVEYRGGSAIRGFYGRALLDGVTVDILADVQLKYSGKWVLITYESLLPCTVKVRLTDKVFVRVPCPEIQVIANRALGRLGRAKTIEDVVERSKCNARVDHCLLTTSP